MHFRLKTKTKSKIAAKINTDSDIYMKTWGGRSFALITYTPLHTTPSIRGPRLSLTALTMYFCQVSTFNMFQIAGRIFIRRQGWKITACFPIDFSLPSLSVAKAKARDQHSPLRTAV